MREIEVHHLVKRFGEFVAVNDISFDVSHGEVFGLLGPNGAGKSTLIRMLTTLLPPTSGDAAVHGYDIRGNANAVRQVIGVIPQAMTSDLELSVEENLLIHAKLYGVPRSGRKQMIADLIEAVQLTAWKNQPIRKLSGGMRRRVEIARGLVHQPSVFFLDEPTTGLDPVSRVAVWEMIEKLKSERDLTVLLTTHYMDEADKLCDRIAIVDHGQLVALDSPMKLKASVPAQGTIEVAFDSTSPHWNDELQALPGTVSVSGLDNLYQIRTLDPSKTTIGLIEAARLHGIEVRSISVESTTLDDVFVHYTGRQLRDAVQRPSALDRSVVVRRD